MGFFKSLFRTQYGQAEGFNFKGKRSLTIEKNQVICFAVGAEDIVLTKDNVASVEPITLNMKVTGFISNGISVVNNYLVKMKDGSTGSITILAGEAYKMLTLLQ